MMDGTAVGQTMKWDGTEWAPASDEGLTSEDDGVVGNEILDVVANKGLARTGAGTVTNPYKVQMMDGTAVGQTMKWNGSAWAPAADAGLTTEVDGSVTNELQTLSISGNTISLSNGGGSVSLPTASEVDGVIGNEVTNATTNGGLSRTGSGTNSDPYTLGIPAGSAIGQSVVWNGTSWGAGNPTAAKNVTSQTGNYTALATDDIIIFNGSTGALTLTLPTSGILPGKILYIVNVGIEDWQLSPVPVNGGIVTAQAAVGTILCM
jgi:hypothetical protein